MQLQQGQSLMHYSLVEKIGEGGMGVVWRALDTNLDREVAIKVLPEALGDAPEWLARFEREARLLASLSHPNIATVHGLHEIESRRFLAMELVPGEDLQQRMRRGRLPLDEVLKINRQVADALEAAHEQGVVHRDLKPANVILTPEGAVKVLDFGLAKSLEPAAVDVDLSHSPTLTHAGTMAGVILGTAGYMAPEQAKGLVVDRRADIWAFGVLLYEMLSGSRLYEEETISESLAAVLLKDPDWDRLPADRPAALDRVVRRCLTKDPRARLRDIGEARIVLERLIQHGDEETSAADTATSGSSLRLWVAAALAVGLLAGYAVTKLAAPSPDGPEIHEALHLSIVPPEEVRLVRNPIISPDGRTIIYIGVAPGLVRLYRRNLASGITEPISGLDGGDQPFFSPDGRWIGYASDGKMKKLSVDGGDPQDILDYPRDSPGAAWLRDGTILFSPGWLTGLHRVSDDGGSPEVLTVPDAAAGEIGHWWPVPLPDGRHVLFTVWSAGSGINDATIAILDLSDGSWSTLLPGARALFSAPDRLLFYRAGSYYAARFDTASLELLGDPILLDLEIEKQWPHGATEQSVALGPGNELAYIPSESLYPLRKLIWTDREGSATVIGDGDRPIEGIALSRDDRLLATTEFDRGRFVVFVNDLTRGTREQLRLDGSVFNARWMPDGQRLSYGVLRRGTFDVFSAMPDGSDERPVVAGAPDEDQLDWFSDGRRLLMGSSGDGNYSVAVHESVTDTQTVLLSGQERRKDVRLSPDDRWLAFTDASSGRDEVYVQRVEGPGPRIRVSSGGGTEPLWCPTDDELYFLGGAEVVAMSFSVESNRFITGDERVLFRTAQNTSAAFFRRSWEVTRDCQRFVMLQPGDDTPSRPELRVVYDW